MSEFIREVDDDYRRDQIRGLLGRYWISILAIAVLVLIGVGGWRGYLYYRQQQNEAASLRYFDATQAVRDDRAVSLAALDSLAKDAPAGYRLLARFKSAGELGQTDAAAGAKAFDALGQDPALSDDLRDIARLRAAMLMADAADPAEAARRFAPLADANGTFRNIAREMLAVIALQRGDDVAAKKGLDAVLSDPVASQDQRQRADLFLGLIRSGKPGEIAAPPAQPANGTTSSPSPGSPTPDQPSAAPQPTATSPAESQPTPNRQDAPPASTTTTDTPPAPSGSPAASGPPPAAAEPPPAAKP